jgi:hypothetical protein
LKSAARKREDAFARGGDQHWRSGLLDRLRRHAGARYRVIAPGGGHRLPAEEALDDAERFAQSRQGVRRA